MYCPLSKVKGWVERIFYTLFFNSSANIAKHKTTVNTVTSFLACFSYKQLLLTYCLPIILLLAFNYTPLLTLEFLRQIVVGQCVQFGKGSNEYKDSLGYWGNCLVNQTLPKPLSCQERGRGELNDLSLLVGSPCASKNK